MEAKSKIEELQHVVEVTKTQQDRPPPEGSSNEKDSPDSPGVPTNNEQTPDVQDASDGSEEESAKSVRTKLSAKIMILQSDISELKASHANEIQQLQQDHQLQLEKMRAQTSGGTGEESDGLSNRVEELELQLVQERERWVLFCKLLVSVL